MLGIKILCIIDIVKPIRKSGNSDTTTNQRVAPVTSLPKNPKNQSCCCFPRWKRVKIRLENFTFCNPFCSSIPFPSSIIPTEATGEAVSTALLPTMAQSPFYRPLSSATNKQLRLPPSDCAPPLSPFFSFYHHYRTM